ncbi:MAG: Mrp/NBP35 family ATP-binding protein [Gammaproteobacteria bacterium]|nr:Mrp/NBP35 family ATP-binding protein [Gammaproteobacteria bacterium]MCP4476327.1 Mrp/NBP35 family ATP-binding protein [Gammaproteobacteria bacterium]
MTDPKTKKLAQVKHIIAVGSGKGGVGKSTTAVNLALALLAQGNKVGLLDADIYGPNQLQMLGLKEAPPASEDGKHFTPLMAHGLEVISMACFIKGDQPAIWRGPMASKALQQLFYDTQWSELDYLIIDLPPGTGDVVLTLAQKFNVDGALIVTTPQDVALADVSRAITMFRKVDIRLLGVVENMSYYHCPNCKHNSHPFGQQGGAHLAENYHIPLLAQLPLDAVICRYADQGTPIVIMEPESEHSRNYLELAQQIINAF